MSTTTVIKPTIKPVQKNASKVKKNIAIGSIYVILSAWALINIYPMFWVLMNAFKPSQAIIDGSFGLPTGFFTQNFINASKQHIFQSYLNSFIISGSVVVGTLLIGSLASYVLARFQFKLKKYIMALVMGSLLIPIFATILPVFDLMYRVDLIDKYLGLILPQIGGNITFTIMVLTGFMSTIPYEMEEAAVMEGCNTSQVFRHVIMPLSKPSLATTAIFTFLWSYNDLFSSLIIMRTKDKMPVNVLLTTISSQYGTDYGLMAAVIIIIVIPVLIVYIIAQNQIVEGMTAGAVKG